jgi:hypothetical protein
MPSLDNWPFSMVTLKPPSIAGLDVGCGCCSFLHDVIKAIKQNANNIFFIFQTIFYERRTHIVAWIQ